MKRRSPPPAPAADGGVSPGFEKGAPTKWAFFRRKYVDYNIIVRMDYSTTVHVDYDIIVHVDHNVIVHVDYNIGNLCC